VRHPRDLLNVFLRPDEGIKADIHQVLHEIDPRQARTVTSFRRRVQVTSGEQQSFP
jgi:hypothetical protein